MEMFPRMPILLVGLYFYKLFALQYAGYCQAIPIPYRSRFLVAKLILIV